MEFQGGFKWLIFFYVMNFNFKQVLYTHFKRVSEEFQRISPPEILIRVSEMFLNVWSFERQESLWRI